MTPNDLDRLLTELLIPSMNSVGFQKRRIGSFVRKVNDCELIFNFSFTRDRGLPGTKYSVFPTLIIRYPKVDELHCLFMGRPYDKREKSFGTGRRSLHTIVPGADSFRYKYCSDNSMNDYAEFLFNDFVDFALSFYDRFDTLDKLEYYFESNHKQSKDGLEVVRSEAYGCCIASVLWLNGKLDECKNFIDEQDAVTCEQAIRIRKYIDKQEK